MTQSTQYQAPGNGQLIYERHEVALRELLSVMLCSGVDVVEITSRIDSWMVPRESYGKLYWTIGTLAKTGIHVTPDVLRNELQDDRDYQGLDLRLLDVEGTLVSPDNVDQYVKQFRQLSQEKRWLNLSAELWHALSMGVDFEHAERIATEFSKKTTVSMSLGWNPKVMDSAEFAAADFQQDYLIKHVLVDLQPGVIGGPEKTLKTGLAVDLAVSLGTGTPFLSNPDFEVPEPVPVMVISGESGDFKLQMTATHVCKARGRLLDTADIHWVCEVPNLNSATCLRNLERMIENRGIRVCILDPAYLCLPGVNMASVNEMGAVLGAVAQIGKRTRCVILIIHHTVKPDRKNPFGPTELADLSGAGWREWPRQWLLIGRRSEYQMDGRHNLILKYGGSAGHSGSRNVLVDEGFPLNQWDVDVSTVSEAKAHQEQEKRLRDEQKAREKADQQLVNVERLDVLIRRQFPNGETRTKIKNVSPFKDAEFVSLLSDLLERGSIEPCEIKRDNRQTYPGVRPVSQGHSGKTVSLTDSHTQSGKPPKWGGFFPECAVSPSGTVTRGQCVLRQAGWVSEGRKDLFSDRDRDCLEIS